MSSINWLVTQHCFCVVAREEFEAAAHKRDHEYQLRVDQLNADLLSHQLRVHYYSFSFSIYHSISTRWLALGFIIG